MATAFDLEPMTPTAPAFRADERRFVLGDVPWWMYVALRDARGDDDGTKMTYLEGTLELMSPSRLHEDVKTIIARLLEAWAMERDVDLRGFGATTFRAEAKRRGLEPDECYKLGPLANDDVPDFAIEVVVSSPLVDKLAVYSGLGVSEVWLWREGRLAVHRLVGGAYEPREASEVLPTLDVRLLERFVVPGENQTRLAKDYQAALRG
ncbi:MAG TPA: Uma2 family endonuclease [Polyangiaceae bacterium]|nr:Uma2 family endonuclease [Polyangiaceae bacterium]